MNLRISTLVPSSRANGPGERAVVWVQGCSLGCPGCFNPETHDFVGGRLTSVEVLLRRLQELPVEGVTISGGEPLQQPAPLERLLRELRSRTAFSVILFSGYAWEEIEASAKRRAVVDQVDLLIAGRYDPGRGHRRDLLGSSNQTFHFITDRYTREELERVPVGEVLITPDGTVLSTGVDPMR